MSESTQAPAPAGQVYLVDNDPLLRSNLGATLGSLGYPVHSFERASDFLRIPGTAAPAVVVVDMMMPDMNGVQLQQQLRARGLETPIIFISGQGVCSEIIQALKQGAIDFLLKPVSTEALLSALQRGLMLDAERHARGQRTLEVRARFRKLTPREREVCLLMLEGHGNKEIAQLNGSAAGTVKLHRSRVLEKMGTETLSSLMRLFKDVDRSRL